MRYSRLEWRHSSPSEPVQILSEYDEDGWEVRKIELFRDGSIHFADGKESVGGSKLSLIQRPPDQEVVDPPDFLVFELTKEDFEHSWEQAFKENHLTQTEMVP